MFENFDRIVEGKIREGKQDEFKAVMEDLVAATSSEEGTLNNQYYVSDDRDVLVYERFNDLQAAQTHVGTWDRFADRWVAAAEPTHMVHMGNLPDELRERHAALEPLMLRPFGGFAK